MKQRPLLGFSLALTAAMTWGTLPIAAQQVLKVIDAQTLVWVRFVNGISRAIADSRICKTFTQIDRL